MRADVPLHTSALSSWRDTVGPLSARSSRLVMALCAAFAAPLFVMAGVRPFCVHMYGEQAEGDDPNGRQLVLRLPGCVYGVGADEWRYWNLLANGLSRSSVEQRPEDGLLLLSDFDDLTMRVVIETAVRWFDPPRRTAGPTGQRDRVTLSCGSRLIDPQVLRNVRGDGKAWIVNVPLDANGGDGMFEVATSGCERMRLQNVSRHCGGHVGVHWLDHMNREGRVIADRWRAEGDFADFRSIDPTTHLTALELIAIFCRLAAAGEEATLAGLTGWPAGTAKLALWKCFEDMVRADNRRAGQPSDAPGRLTINLHSFDN